MNGFELHWEEPAFLLVLILVPLFILLDLMYLHRVHTAVRRSGMILRAAMLTAGVCMLAGLTLYTAHTQVDMVILADVSDSMDEQTVSALTGKLTEQTDEYASVRIVRFAGRVFENEEEPQPAECMATNLCSALNAGAQFHREGRRLHLMLLTDGLETEGNLHGCGIPASFPGNA